MLSPLLSVAVRRLDLLYAPDEAAPLLHDDEDILKRRAAQLWRAEQTDRLSPFCIRVLLDNSALEPHGWDLGDLQEEIERKYPRTFEVLRSVQHSPQGSRLRLRPVIRRLQQHGDIRMTLPTLTNFLTDLRSCSFTPSEQIHDINGVDDHGEVAEDTRMGTENLQAFFRYLDQLDWITYNCSPGIVTTTDIVARRPSEFIYDSQTGFLEKAENCVHCNNDTLPRELSNHDVARGYCPQCLKKKFRCNMCLTTLLSDVSMVITVCDCRYCESCFGKLFTSQLTRDAFPPKCCDQEISVIMYRQHLLESSLRLYTQLMDSAKDNVQLYCANTKCQKYLRPSLIRDEWGLCDECFSVTCQRCRTLHKQHTFAAVGGERQCPSSAEVGEVSQSPGTSPLGSDRNARSTNTSARSSTQQLVLPNPVTETLTAATPDPLQPHALERIPSLPIQPRPSADRQGSLTGSTGRGSESDVASVARSRSNGPTYQMHNFKKAPDMESPICQLCRTRISPLFGPYQCSNCLHIYCWTHKNAYRYGCMAEDRDTWRWG